MAVHNGENGCGQRLLFILVYRCADWTRTFARFCAGLLWLDPVNPETSIWLRLIPSFSV